MASTTYTLSRNFRAPLLNGGQSFSKFKQFNASDSVSGYITNEATTNQDVVATDDGYLIPVTAINMPRMATAQATDAPQAQKTPADLPKELQDKLNAIKSTDIVGNIVKQSRTSVNGLMIGAGIGLLIAIFRRGNYIPSILLGALGGGYFGYKVANKTKK